MIKKIINSIDKFNLNLKYKNVLTEAATGNYVVTPIIAALSGAKVFAFTKNTRFGTVEKVKDQTYQLASQLNVIDKIMIVDNLDKINLNEMDILTNTGFLRPINEELINKLSEKCVIPLMWEPWEWRKDELDIEACYKKGIKVYGTNESDPRLKTMDYIGYIALYFLLVQKLSPYSAKILILGCEKFANPISKILKQNNYNYQIITDYKKTQFEISKYNAIIIAENTNDIKLIGNNNCSIKSDEISEDTTVIHIAGNVDFSNGKFIKVPEKPAPFGYMSFTTDFIDSQAVIDLHTAGFKVAEGMLKSNEMNLNGLEYKDFMESNYPALAFDNKRFW